jgi:hypothetical protein
MSAFVGPYDASTQRAADHYAKMAGEHGWVASHTAAIAVARDVADGRDGRDYAQVYDACRRDEEWSTAEILSETRDWTEREGWTLRS